jgi:hypothetical protein
VGTKPLSHWSQPPSARPLPTAHRSPRAEDTVHHHVGRPPTPHHSSSSLKREQCTNCARTWSCIADRSCTRGTCWAGSRRRPGSLHCCTRWTPHTQTLARLHQTQGLSGCPAAAGQPPERRGRPWGPHRCDWRGGTGGGGQIRGWGVGKRRDGTRNGTCSGSDVGGRPRSGPHDGTGPLRLACPRACWEGC